MKKVNWGIFLAWLFLTVFLCLQDGKTSGAISTFIATIFGLPDHYLRKFAHFFVHFVLAVLCFRAMRTTVKDKHLIVLVSILVSLIFAVIDETFQMFATERSAELRDVFINISGVTLGTIFGIFTSSKVS